MHDALITTAQIARIYRVTAGRIRQVVVARHLRPDMIAGHTHLWRSSRIDQFDPRRRRESSSHTSPRKARKGTTA